MPLTEYRVQGPGPVQVPSGRVGLTVDQARRRLHALRATPDSVAPSDFRRMHAGADAGIWEAAQPLQFKAGEVFRWDGIPPKAEPVQPAVDAEAADGTPEEEASEDEPPEDEAELQRRVEALGVEYKVEPIREALADLEIAYPERARKADLARLLVDNAELAP